MTSPGGYSAGTIFLQVVPSFRNFQNTVRKAAKEADRAFAEGIDKNTAIEQALDKALDKGTKKAGDTYGSRMAQEMGKSLGREIDTIFKKIAPISLRADTSLAGREVDIFARKLDALREKAKDFTLAGDSKGLAKINADLKQLAATLSGLKDDVTISGDGDFQGLLRQLDLLDSAIDRVDGRKIDVDGGGFLALAASASQGANAIRGFNVLLLAGATLGPALIPILGALAGGFLALGTAALGAAAGVGVAILAFSGVSDAVKAMGKAQEDGAEQARALAKTQRNAKNAVVDAQEGVARAARSSADAQKAAAERVSDAQRAVVRAHQDARQGVERALRGVAQAERDLARAQRDSTRAQEEVREARKAAQADLADLDSKVKAGALAERQQLIDLFEAQVAYNAAQADGGATNLEQEQAAINLERARLAISDQRRENIALREEQKKAGKAGVENSEAVTAARERQVDQAQRQKDAEQELADARERLRFAQEQGAEKIADAVERLSDAQRAQANAGVENNAAMAAAQRNLTQAQENYRDALAQTTATADALADSMGKLSPAGQRFATFIFGLRDEFGKLRAAAQEGMLPGVENALRTLLPFMPQITAFVGEMGKALGGLAESAAKGLTSGPFLEFFKTMGELAPTFTKQFGAIFGNLATIFAQVATAFAPLAVTIGDALVKLTGQFSDFLASEAGQKAIADFIGYVKDVGPEVADFFFALVKAVGNLAVALAPYAGVLLNVLTGFLNFVANMPPALLGAIVVSILLLVGAFQALSLIIGVVGLVAGVISAIGGAIAFLGPLVIASIASIAVFVLGFIAIGIALVVLYKKFETFRNIVDGVFGFLKDVVVFFWEKIIKPIFGFIVGYLKFMYGVWSSIFSLIWGILRFTGRLIRDFYNDNIKKYVDAIVIVLKTALAPAFSAIGDAAKSAWDFIKDMFSSGIEFVVKVINEGFIDPFNTIADFFGSKPIKRLVYDEGTSKTVKNAKRQTSTKGGTQAFATGGMVGGFSATPTADNIPAWLTAGEFVLPVNAVKKLRAAFGDGFLSWLQGGGGYSKGGLVEFGRLLQSKQFRVSEHPAFGGVRGRHSKNSYHYRNQAIDVNYGPGGQNAIEMKAIDAIVGLAKEYGLRSIWRTDGHFNHAHFDTGDKSKSILGKIGDAVGGAVEWAKDGPIGWLKDKIGSIFGQAVDTPFGRVVRDMGGTIFNNAVGFVKGIAGSAGDFLPEDKPKLYDTGGWLPPGISQVANYTGKPELILTPEQAEAVMSGGARYEINVPMLPTNSTPNEVADAVLFAARQINRGGVYAGKR